VQTLKEFFNLLSFLLTSYLHGDYKYIEIKVERRNIREGTVLRLKDEVFFDHEDLEKNKSIISEIMIGLNRSSPDVISLCNKSIDENVIDLLIEALKKGLIKKLKCVEVDLSQNKIDYNTLNKFFNVRSTPNVLDKLNLQYINLSKNEISGFLNKPESINTLKEFLENQRTLKVLDLSENINEIKKSGIKKLFESLTSLDPHTFKTFQTLNLTRKEGNSQSLRILLEGLSEEAKERKKIEFKNLVEEYIRQIAQKAGNEEVVNEFLKKVIL